MGLTRLLALVRKEFLALFRDPKSRVILIAPPVLQLLVFSYAATLEVRNVDVMVLNRDAGHWGSEFISRIDASPQFRHVQHTDNPAELHDAIDREWVIAAVEIGANFSRDIEAGSTADMAVILDGRRSQRLADRRRLYFRHRQRPSGRHASRPAARVRPGRHGGAQLVQSQP